MTRVKLFDNATELENPETVTLKEIPSYLSGVLIQNGPAKFDLSDTFTVNNYMDGYAMLSRFEINGTEKTVAFTKRYLDSEAYRKATAFGKPCFIESFTRAYADPEKNIFLRHLPQVVPCFSDNGNAGIYAIGDDVFTGTEACMFQHVDSKSLRCKAKFDAQEVFKLSAVTTHPLEDPYNSGVFFNIGQSFTAAGLKYHLFKIQPKGTAEKTFNKLCVMGSIPSSFLTKIGYVHSFGLTKNYVILVEQPFQNSVPKILAAAIRPGHSLNDFSTWDQNFKNRFFVISKSTGNVVFDVDVRAENQFFHTHTINCYEEGDGHVVIDLIGFNDLGLLDSVMIKHLRTTEDNKAMLPTPRRYVFPLLKSMDGVEEIVNLNSGVNTTATAVRNGKTIFLSPEVLSEPGVEFPTCNSALKGKQYKYFYGTGSFYTSGHYTNSLVKVDMTSKEVFTFKGAQDEFFNEPKFIWNPSAQDEDDGVLLSTISSTSKSGKDSLLFLDAKNMKEIGRANFNASIPIALHSLFLKATK